MSNFMFYIAYDGPALEANEMPIRELAPSLLALSDAFEEANREINGQLCDIRLNVKASFKTGCFGIDLVAVQSLKNSIANLLSGASLASAADVATVLGFNCINGGIGLIWLLKKIRGRKIQKIEVSGKKATIVLDDEHVETEEGVVRCLRNSKIREALDDVVCKPLARGGITHFTVADNALEAFPLEITQEEKDFFKAPEVEEEVIEDGAEYETTYQLVGVSFQEGNKWRFSDGSSVFYADIADRDFLFSVDIRAVVFAKGDILRVLVAETQKLTKGGIKTDKVIKKVLSHRHASLQLPLPVVVKGEE